MTLIWSHLNISAVTIHHGGWIQSLSRTLKDSEWNENMICTKCHYLCTVVVHSALDNFSGHSLDASTSLCSGRTSSHTASHTTHKTFQNHGTIMVQWCRGPVNTRNINKPRSCETTPVLSLAPLLTASPMGLTGKTDLVTPWRGWTYPDPGCHQTLTGPHNGDCTLVLAPTCAPPGHKHLWLSH